MSIQETRTARRFALLVAARVLILGGVALSLLPALLAEGHARHSFRDTVGIYHWGGPIPGVAAGLKTIVDLNGTVARIALSSRMAVDYKTGTACLEGFRLAAALDDPELRKAIADPRLRVLMFTAYDGTSYSDCSTHRYLSPAFYTQANSARIAEEYSDFVYRLYTLYGGSGKVFIVSNWESDNVLYCGQAWTYAVSPEFRRDCDLQYPRYYAGNRNVAESADGLVLWFKARHLGVVMGRERAASEGFGKLEVLVAPEICTVNALRERGLTSVLYDILPRVPFDAVSYSSWESLEQKEPVAALRADLDRIRTVAGTGSIIVGELGFARSDRRGSTVPLTLAVTETALDWGVRYAFHWNLFDQQPGSEFGLYDAKAQITSLGAYYKTMFECGSMEACPAGHTQPKDNGNPR